MAASEGREPGPNDPLPEDIPVERTASANSNRETTSLKRTREGSVEPYPTGSTAQPSASTKKNRLAPAKEVPEPDSSPVIGKGAALAPDVDIGDSNAVSATEEGGAMDESTAPTEGQTVGEVRRQVEKMTYEEGQTGDAVAVDKELRRAASAGGGQSQESKTENDNEEEWEEIDKTEVDEAKASEREGKELKRKALDRSESSFVKDDEAMAKRQKETPSPTPNDEPADPAPSKLDAEIKSDLPKKPQATFSAFSSSASPFTARSASPFTAGDSTTAFRAATPSKSTFSTSGFGNYSASFSPFTSKKATPAAEEADKESKAGPSSFGDILISAKGDEKEGPADKPHMTEQDIPTGEEEEETVYATRAKLYVMQTDGGWRERGVGTVKLNLRRSDGRGARLVMRAEGVLRLILNVSLYVGMTCLEDGKHVRMTVFEDSERRLITFRTGSQKVASELCGFIHDHIPLESARASEEKSPDPETITAAA